MDKYTTCIEALNSSHDAEELVTTTTLACKLNFEILAHDNPFTIDNSASLVLCASLCKALGKAVKTGLLLGVTEAVSKGLQAIAQISEEAEDDAVLEAIWQKSVPTILKVFANSEDQVAVASCCEIIMNCGYGGLAINLEANKKLSSKLQEILGSLLAHNFPEMTRNMASGAIQALTDHESNGKVIISGSSLVNDLLETMAFSNSLDFSLNVIGALWNLSMIENDAFDVFYRPALLDGVLAMALGVTGEEVEILKNSVAVLANVSDDGKIVGRILDALANDGDTRLQQIAERVELSEGDGGEDAGMLADAKTYLARFQDNLNKEIERRRVKELAARVEVEKQRAAQLEQERELAARVEVEKQRAAQLEQERELAARVKVEKQQQLDQQLLQQQRQQAEEAAKRLELEREEEANQAAAKEEKNNAVVEEIPSPPPLLMKSSSSVSSLKTNKIQQSEGKRDKLTDFTIINMCSVLRVLSLSKYIPQFIENEIDGATIIQCNNIVELTEIGISLTLHSKKLFKWLTDIKRSELRGGGDGEPSRELEALNVTEVGLVLSRLKMASYSAVFLNNEIDGETLSFTKSKTDFEKLNLLPAHTRKLMAHIKVFKCSGVPLSFLNHLD
ncbi:hypothetical protein ScalyP_jg11440 [Parmales sp. scaly parma]|nr:hypothetical protein ScalyP_jg11440 [Parmales sp. scaly parma]